MHLTLRQLQIFDAVVHQQSFTRAADALHVTQPAVSMQMRQLEEQIGVPLFDHVGKQIQPTDAGRELHRHATLIGAKRQAAVCGGAVLPGVPHPAGAPADIAQAVIDPLRATSLSSSTMSAPLVAQAQEDLVA